MHKERHIFALLFVSCDITIGNCFKDGCVLEEEYVSLRTRIDFWRNVQSSQHPIITDLKKNCQVGVSVFHWNLARLTAQVAVYYIYKKKYRTGRSGEEYIFVPTYSTFKKTCK